MAYIGKEFKFEKQENYEEFINELVKAQDKASNYLSFKPNQTLLKNGDEYTLVITVKEANFKKEVTFKPGVTFDEELAGGLKAKSTITVDGDTFTQVQEFDQGSVTMKREFSADKLKVTISSSLCGISAVRYYVPA